MNFQVFHVNPGKKLKKKDVNNDLSHFMSVFPNTRYAHPDDKDVSSMISKLLITSLRPSEISLQLIFSIGDSIFSKYVPLKLRRMQLLVLKINNIVE